MMTSHPGISPSKRSIFWGGQRMDKTCDNLPSLHCLAYISQREVVEEDHYPPKIKATMGTKISSPTMMMGFDGAVFCLHLHLYIYK